MLHSHFLKALLPVVAAALSLYVASVGAQETVQLEIDANPAGNTLSEAGPADDCVAVQPGDTFAIQLLIRNVENLLAYDIYVEYDHALLEVSDRETNFFLDLNPGSRVTDLSAGVPDSDGLYNVAAVDTADPERPDSGSGILGEITFTALSEGTAEITIAQLDIDGDEIIDVGPLLRDNDLNLVGDQNGDSFFDGEWEPVEARIGGVCDGSAPTGTSPDSTVNPGNGPGSSGNGGGGGIGAMALVAMAAGGVLLVGAIVVGRRLLFRHSDRPLA